MARKLFGGEDSKTPVEGIGIELPIRSIGTEIYGYLPDRWDIRIICQVCEKRTGGTMFTGVVEEKG